MKINSRALLSCLFLASSLLIEAKTKRDAAVKVLKLNNRRNQDIPKKQPRSVIVTKKLEKELISGIDKSIQYLEKTVRQLPRKSRARFKMKDRILNLNLEQAAYVASEEQQDFDEKWGEWDQLGRKGREPRISKIRSSGLWRRVYNLSQDIIKEFPKTPGVDRIHFTGALALQSLGQDTKANREFQRIIRSYPKSQVAGDAYYSVGEYYFYKNQFRKAMTQYRKSLNYRKSKRYGWSIFKLAWCFYNLGQYRNALKNWKKTIRYSQNVGLKGQKLRDEALRDAVFAFTELKQVNEAIRFYQQQSAESYIPDFLKLMATTYANQGNFNAAVSVWTKLLKLYPRHKYALDAQIDIIALNYEKRNYSVIWQKLEELAIKFSPQSSWARHNEREKVESSKVLIKQNVLYYPKVIHKEGLRNRKKNLLQAAVFGYYLYLKLYPKSFEEAEIKEYIADIEYSRRNYQTAGILYQDIVQLGPKKAVVLHNRAQTSIHQRSAVNMLDAFNKNFLPELQQLIKITPNFKKPKRRLSKKSKYFLNACKVYRKWYSKDAKTMKTCDLYTSEIYYRSGHKNVALNYLWLILRKYAHSKEGVKAVETIIPIYQEDKKELQTALRKILSIPQYNKGKFGTRLFNLLRSMDLEAIARVSSPLKRAQSYRAAALKNPKGKDVDSLWNNAASDFLKAGRVLSAIRAYQVVANKRRKSLAYKTSLLQLAKLEQARFRYQESAQYFNQYALSYPQAKDAAAALQNACRYYIALQSSKARRVCINFATRHPRFGATAIESLYQSYYLRGLYPQMVDLIRRNYLTKFKLSASQIIIANYWIYKVSGGRGKNGRQARAAITKFTGKKVDGEALRYLGEIAFSGVQGRYKTHQRIRLRGGSAERLQQGIQRIFQSLENLEQSYNKVFQTQDSYWSVAGLYQLGRAYEDFSQKLANPPNIKGASRSEVKNQLISSVKQLQDKATLYYRSAINTATKFNVLNEWRALSFNALNRISGSKVSFEEWVVSPDFVGSLVSDQVKEYL